MSCWHCNGTRIVHVNTYPIDCPACKEREELKAAFDILDKEYDEIAAENEKLSHAVERISKIEKAIESARIKNVNPNELIAEIE